MAIAFFSRYSEEFPQLADELAALREEVAVDPELESLQDSYAISQRLERAAGRAKGMLKSAAGGDTVQLCAYE